MTDASRIWVSRLAPYKQPDDRRAVFEIAVTVIPFILCWLAMWALMQVSVFLALALSLPAAGLLVRLFIIQHDCGHGSMFSSRRANDWVGRLLGVVTLTPYDYWRHSHALHHASSGNLDKRGFGDIDTLTVDEYLARDWRGRLQYRLYRHPLVMFGLGPAYLFLLQHRLPPGARGKGTVLFTSTVATNIGIALAYALLIALIGFPAFLAIQLPIVILSASAGVWLFYVQHQFDPAHWARGEEWNHSEAALHGSSYYDLPAPLMWLTGNIGIHHVHHLSSRIPFHRLPQILRDYPELKGVGRLTIRQSLKCVPLALWDEKAKRLISFKDFRQQVAAA